MVQVLRSTENSTVETRGEVSRLCSLTGILQRMLELEYSTPRDGYAREVIIEANPEKEQVIPLFPLLEEKKDKGKKNEEPGTS
ncbi:hypothetical protein ACFX2F_043590 [Malus domestica]